MRGREISRGCLLLIDPSMEPRNGDAVLVEDEDHRALVRVYARGSSTLLLSPDFWSDEIPDIVGSPEDPPVRLVGTVEVLREAVYPTQSDTDNESGASPIEGSPW